MRGGGFLRGLLREKVSVEGRKYVVDKQIGEGGFAFVFEGRLVARGGGRGAGAGGAGEGRLALKRMICQTEAQLQEARKEVEIMRHAHKNRVPLLAAEFVENGGRKNRGRGRGQAVEEEVDCVCWIVMPLFTNGSLTDVIEGGERGFPYSAFADENMVRRILTDTCEGLASLHALGWKHCDVKPQNILLRSDFSAAITDFGSAQPLVTEVHSRQEDVRVQEDAAIFSTAPFRAPELFDTPNECVIDGKVDVWALGCTLFAMLFSRTPFENPTEGFLGPLAVISGEVHIPSGRKASDGGDISAGMIQLLELLLTADLGQRPSMEQVLGMLNSAAQGGSFTFSGRPDATAVTTAAPAQPAFATGGFADFDAAFASPGGALGADAKATSAAVGTAPRQPGENVDGGSSESPLPPPHLKEDGRALSAGTRPSLDWGDFQAAGEQAPLPDADASTDASGKPGASPPSVPPAVLAVSNASPSSMVNGGNPRRLRTSSTWSLSSALGSADILMTVPIKLIRRRGIPPKMVEKQVFLSITADRVIVSKFQDPNSKVHNLIRRSELVRADPLPSARHPLLDPPFPHAVVLCFEGSAPAGRPASASSVASATSGTMDSPVVDGTGDHNMLVFGSLCAADQQEVVRILGADNSPASGENDDGQGGDGTEYIAPSPRPLSDEAEGEGGINVVAQRASVGADGGRDGDGGLQRVSEGEDSAISQDTAADKPAEEGDADTTPDTQPAEDTDKEHASAAAPAAPAGEKEEQAEEEPGHEEQEKQKQKAKAEEEGHVEGEHVKRADMAQTET